MFSVVAVMLGCSEASSPSPAPPPAPPPGTASVQPDGVTIMIGAEVTLHASVVNFTATGWSWSVNDPSKASITTEGVLRGLTSGTVGVRACAKNSAALCAAAVLYITSVPVPPLAAVHVTPAHADLTVGATLQFSVQATGVSPPWSWTTGTTSVARVSATGAVTAVAAGTTYLAVCSTATGMTNVCGFASIQVH